MKKKWCDIKVGDVMKDGSIVTQIHRTHEQDACRIIYDNDKEFICSTNHILLIDVSNLPKEGFEELEKYCTFVPLEENYSIICYKELSIEEKLIIDKFCHNEPINIKIDCIDTVSEIENYNFYFDSGVKNIKIKNVIIKSEPQKVDEHTYWLNCNGIKYLMDTYHVDLYCNNNIINSMDYIGKKPCFCISTNTGRYET